MRYATPTKESTVNIDLLIERYHDGEIDKEELVRLNDWLLADKANQSYFLESGNIRSEIANALSVDNKNNNKTAKLRGQQQRTRSTSTRNHKNKALTGPRLFMAAAALIIGILSFYYYNNTQTNAHTQNTGTLLITAINGECSIVNKTNKFTAHAGYHLQDGDTLETKALATLILTDRQQNKWTLSQDTTATYTAQKLQVLDGTVHTSINPKLKHTTQISTEFCGVHVTGTEFSVRHEGTLSTIQVTDGKVRVDHRNTKQIHVSSGHQLSADKDGFLYTSMTEWATGFTLNFPKTGKIIPAHDPLKDGDEISLSKLGIDTISVNTNLNSEVEHLIDRVDLFINGKLLKVFVLKEHLWDMKQIQKMRLHILDHTFGPTRIHAIPYFNKEPGQIFSTQISIVE